MLSPAASFRVIPLLLRICLNVFPKSIKSPLFYIYVNFNFYVVYFFYTLFTNKQEGIKMFYYIYKFWKENLVVTLILFFTGLCQTIVSVQVASALDALIAFNFNHFLRIIGIVLGLFAIQLIFVRLQIIKISQVKQKMATAIRTDITQRIEKMGYNEFHKRQVGTYASWLSNDLSTIETVGFDNFYALLTGSIATLTSVIALLFFHWSLVLWTVVAGALTIFLPKIFEKQMAKSSLNTTKENERFLSR